MALTGVDLAVSVLTLVGNITSALGAGLMILCYLFVPLGTHFRHRLILNLAIADFMNAMCGTISQIWAEATHQTLSKGLGCTIDGIFIQISVQAVDVSILAIAVVTVLGITKTRDYDFNDWSKKKGAIALGAIWILPVTTSLIALGINGYTPVSGGWCWLEEDPVYIRYVLTHGWRFLFIFIIIILYTWLHIFLRQHFADMHSATGSSFGTSGSNWATNTVQSAKEKVRKFSRGLPGAHEPEDDEISLTNFRNKELDPIPSPMFPPNSAHIQNTISGSIFSSSPKMRSTPATPYQENATPSATSMAKPTTNYFPSPALSKSSPFPLHSDSNFTPSSESEPKPLNHHLRSNTQITQKKVRKILLMRAYPTWFVLLWIPGLANRLVEAAGHSSPALQVLQCTTSYIGLINAVTYGWNEEIFKALRRMVGAKRKSMGELDFA